MTDNFTGYRPDIIRLYFDGYEVKYEFCEIKFFALLWLELDGLRKVVKDDGMLTLDLREINWKVFAKLIQFLDDKSLSLTIRDAEDDGTQDLKILKEYYIGNTKPRIIGLYTELTSLVMGTNEGITDYIIRAESVCKSSKSDREGVSDSLLITMILKYLSAQHGAFSTVITQKNY